MKDLESNPYQVIFEDQSNIVSKFDRFSNGQYVLDGILNQTGTRPQCVY